ncbi:DNA polymerase III, alpha subunit [Alicyclobacillus hesperidum URH17-3-68]|nr:DNA polymerase III, alpha subunit [Alicyclobacillus hesperidum URH17-3-68]
MLVVAAQSIRWDIVAAEQLAGLPRIFAQHKIYLTQYLKKSQTDI